MDPRPRRRRLRVTIEALRVPGSSKLTVTGQLGDVMRESVDACSYVRSRARALRIVDAEMKATDLHIHFPAGSVPKDGQGAGVAVRWRSRRRDGAGVPCGATWRSPAGDAAWGWVLEIGGVKEKVLAAYQIRACAT